MTKSETYEKHGEEIISGLVVCLVDHFRNDIISGRISIEKSLVGDPHMVDGKGLIVPVIVRDNYKGNANLVYTMFKANADEHITAVVPKVVARDDIRKLLDF